MTETRRITKELISIHAPRVGSDFSFFCHHANGGAISIHAPRVGSDVVLDDLHGHAAGFQSTLPVWGATQTARMGRLQELNFNPRSPCGERPRGTPGAVYQKNISIHAPRVGSDGDNAQPFGELDISIHAPRVGSDKYAIIRRSQGGISIHAPRVGSDINDFHVRCGTNEFQSTLPVWGATPAVAAPAAEEDDISIHAPRVGSDVIIRNSYKIFPISIHAPRVGSDNACFWTACTKKAFQSTLPVWGATNIINKTFQKIKYFNPRSPCGERRRNSAPPTRTKRFQSTLPVWGATTWPDVQRCKRPHFNPRSPCGERPPGSALRAQKLGISIHAPRVGSDYLARCAAL